MKKLSILILILSSAVSLFAQSAVEGTVTDTKTGQVLIGATIQVKGTVIGTITDLNGRYSIAYQFTSTTALIVSFIGYEKKEVIPGGQKVLDIQLSADQIMLDEMVVVGYGSAKKRDILGAVTSVKNEDINKLPLASVAQALQGRAAGVLVTQNTGAPGEGVSIRIRGIGSINSGNEPLYIVDGIPTVDALKILSPGDIEKITVLKDASSAAIYGSRANNGVVLITTKKGKSGKTKVTYKGQTGFQKAVRLTKMVNTTDYITIYNEAATNDNAFLPAGLQRALILPEDTKEFANVNYVKELLQTAPINSHEISISGGNDATNYMISTSLFDQKGIIKGSGYTRGTAKLDVNTKVNQWLSAGIGMLAGFSSNDIIGSSGDGAGGNGGSVIRYAFFRNPAIPIRFNDGRFVDRPAEFFGNQKFDSFLGDGYNPIGMSEYNDNNKKDNSFLGKAYVVADITKNLKFTTNIGIDYRNSFNRRFNRTWGMLNRINAVNGLDIGTENAVNWSMNNLLNHEIKIGTSHTLATMLGFEVIKNMGSALYASDMNFPVEQEELIYIGNGMGNKISSQSAWVSSLASFFGRLNYDYKGKYYFSGTIRRDGSSRFINDNKWGTFYSLSGGWILKQESFLSNVSWLENLKLRAGYGAVGNQDISLYANNDRISPYYNYIFGGVSNSGYAQSSLGNDNLKWETSYQYNGGLDAEFLKGAFSFSIDYYYKVTEGMLMKATNPPSVGYASSPWINNGSVKNTGVEFETVYRKNGTDWAYAIGGNIGFLVNAIASLDAAPQNGVIETGQFATLGEIGQPIGSFYLLEMAGIFQNATEILLSAKQDGDIKPGDVKYKDRNGDGYIDNKDMVHLGSAIPKITTGINFNANFKNFDVSMFLQGAYGNKIYMQINQDIEGFYRGFTVTQRYFDERWTGAGSTGTQPRPSWTSKSNNARPSSRFLEDGSYLRLKNVQLGYTMPENSLKTIGMSNVRFYVSGSNLYTLTKFPGLDPEMTVSDNAKGEGDNAAGIDWGTYPSAMTVMFGIDITF